MRHNLAPWFQVINKRERTDFTRTGFKGADFTIFTFIISMDMNTNSEKSGNNEEIRVWRICDSHY